MPDLIDRLIEKFLSGGKYVLFSAGFLCLFFLLSPALAAETDNSFVPCRISDVEQTAILPQTAAQTSSLLRLSVRRMRPASQLRNNDFSANAAVFTNDFCPEKTKNCFFSPGRDTFCWHSFARKSRPVRAGPETV